ncbi:MAG TPA: polysaccharide deacetylase family protein [Patescibacteria group bacterium]|nr:polysaccharide deacetylase family protein [Patescibacteria group bacterium]
MSNITVFFDYEGKWGMPYKSEYDLVKTTNDLLSLLRKYKVKAVFFVVGKIVEENPSVVKKIAAEGHEIAVHGYLHEHLDRLTDKELEIFSDKLSKIESSLEKLIGKRPVGFRSPYLMAPKFHTPELYKILKAHGYKWVSNRDLRYSEEIFRPDRFNLPFMWGKKNILTDILSPLLSLDIILKDRVNNGKGLKRIAQNIAWVNNGIKPFKRYGLVEIPLTSPFDCDLLGLPKPKEKTPEAWAKYVTACFVGGANRSQNLYTLNLHDWIMGSSNRISILDETLKSLSSNKKNRIDTVENFTKSILKNIKNL